MKGAAITLARYWARRDVKARLRAQGLKPWDVEPTALALAARAHLAEHPELIEQATAWLGANLRSAAQRKRACNARASAVQMS